MSFFIATRKSMLALKQAQMVSLLLQKSGFQTELLPLVTTGDKLQKSPLADINLNTDSPEHLKTGKGLFIKEIQEALLSKKAQIAVHSMKDLPITQTEGLALAALLPRASPNDVLILSPNVLKEIGISDLRSTHLSYEELKNKLLTSSTFLSGPIGTTSGRRQLLMKKHFSASLNLQTLRGNVDSRLKKVRNNEFAAILLAQAGLERLELCKASDMFLLPLDKFIPAAAQGIIAIEVPLEEKELFQKTILLTSAETCLQAGMERLVLSLLDGDCHSPVGVHFKNQNLACIWEKNHVVKEVTIQIDSQEFSEIEDLYKASGLIYSVFFENLDKHPLAQKIKRIFEKV